MPTFTLSNEITEKDLLSFELFTPTNTITTSELIPLVELEASEDILNYQIRNIKWTGYKNSSIDKTHSIGYNLTTDLNGKGLTESDAYNYWIDDFKTKERKFKKLMSLSSLSQSQYDGLLSLYYSTGDYTTVGSDIRKFRLSDYIANRQWEYVATAMSLAGGKSRIMRQGEGKIIMLADYGVQKSRAQIKAQGLQELVKQYPNRLFDDIARQQAEYVYFKETQRFLPNISESRKRILARELK